MRREKILTENRRLKISNYNHFLHLEDDDSYLVYNSISNALAKLDLNVYDRLREGNKGIRELVRDESNQEMIQQLCKGNIIIDEDLDEIELLKAKFDMKKFSMKYLSLTIIPTQDCCLRCIYCYEGDLKKKYADAALEDDILKFAGERVKTMGYKGIHVTWYGGEPLMNKEFIYSLSRKFIAYCKSEKLMYSATLVSNGIILNKTITNKLKSLKVERIQITLDGPRGVHDRRRPFKESKKSSFDIIVNNIEKILGIIPIILRMNVDKTNFANTFELLDYLKKKDWLGRPHDIFVYMGFTRDWTEKCSNIVGDCFSMKEFSYAELKFQKELHEKGSYIVNAYPNPTAYCVAATPHGFVIEPGGEIHKCWSDVGNEDAYLGTVKDPLVMNKKLLQWLSYDPLANSSECRECRHFPVCAGGCPYVHIKRKEKIQEDKNYNCTPWKHFLEEKMQLFMKEKAKELTNTNKNKN